MANVHFSTIVEYVNLGKNCVFVVNPGTPEIESIIRINYAKQSQFIRNAYCVMRKEFEKTKPIWLAQK